MKYQLLLLLFFASFSINAQILVEPSVGFHSGGKAGLFEKNSFTGIGAGLKTGVKAGAFIGGLEMVFARLDREGQEEKINTSDIGAFLGFETDFGLRGWTTLNFLTVYNYNDLTYDGSGFKFGLGLAPFSFMSFNIEYQEYFYFRVNQSEMDRDLTLRSLFISLSSPIYF